MFSSSHRDNLIYGVKNLVNLYCRLRDYSSVRTQFLGPLCLWQCLIQKSLNPGRRDRIHLCPDTHCFPPSLLLPPSYPPSPPTARERLTLKRLHPHSLPGLTEKYNLNYITFLVHVAMYGYFWPCKGLFLRFWAYLNEPCSPLASVLFSKLWWSNLYQAICFYL